MERRVENIYVCAQANTHIYWICINATSVCIYAANGFLENEIVVLRFVEQRKQSTMDTLQWVREEES